MKRTPAFHIAIGMVVVLGASFAGSVQRNVKQWGKKPRYSCNRTFPTNSAPTTSAADDADRTLIVKYRASASKLSIEGLLKRLHMREEASYPNLPRFSFQQVESGDIESVIAELKADPNVEYVERNLKFQKDDTQPNDPDFLKQWGHFNNGQPVNGGRTGKSGVDIGALTAWDTTTGSDKVVVGVIDTGIDYTHEDLVDNMWVNDREIPNNGKDDDKNGIIDDYYGFNAVRNSGNPMDDQGHGTHCAGVIGAKGDNGAGIAGVNWNVRLMALKFLDENGSGRLNDALECVNYAVAMKKRGVNLRVLSNSWGGGGYSRALEDAIKLANDNDILFVAAAGNDASNNDRYPHYPSSYDVPNVVAVAALDANDGIASFSCYGKKSVHLAAPGVDVYSTVPAAEYGTGYMHFSGTSMATPYVAGAAALVLAQNPKLTTKELKARLLDSTVPVAELKGKTVTGGRLNVAQALAR